MRYAVDFEGWLYIDSYNREDAMEKAFEILKPLLDVLYKKYDADWEITSVEAVE